MTFGTTFISFEDKRRGKHFVWWCRWRNCEKSLRGRRMPRGHWHQGNGRHQTDGIRKRQPVCPTPFKCTCSNLHWQMFQGKKVITSEMSKCISSVYILSSYKYVCLLVIFLFWKFHFFDNLDSFERNLKIQIS